MFFPRTTPAQRNPRALSALRVSLNAPVVATDDLPPGPARAAIALWLEAAAARALEVRVRSLGTGQLVAYGFDGPLDAPGEVDTALEAALTFAESMGFVFDHDVLSGDDSLRRQQRIQVWAEFEGLGQGEAEGFLADPELGPGAQDAAAEDELLELTELVDPTPDEAPEREPAATLTKFRGGPLETATASPADGVERPGSRRTALGRLPLVRRQHAKEARARPGLLLRILGAF